MSSGKAILTQRRRDRSVNLENEKKTALRTPRLGFQLCVLCVSACGTSDSTARLLDLQLIDDRADGLAFFDVVVVGVADGAFLEDDRHRRRRAEIWLAVFLDDLLVVFFAGFQGLDGVFLEGVLRDVFVVVG